MKQLIYIPIFLLAACKGGETVQVKNLPAQTPMPAWVQQRPVSGFDYIGIGTAAKYNSDHQETAKRNALNDLASEISVNIEGNSLLYTLDRSYKFEEEFSSTIRATTSERLEGFEIVDTWSDAEQYWVYYRLDKSKHEQLKAARKARALTSAKDLFNRAQASILAGNIREAFDGNIRALLAMKDYWNEADRTELNGEEVLLGNHIYARLQDLSAKLVLNPLPASAKLNLANDFSTDIRLAPEFVENDLAVGLKQLPIIIEIPRREYVQRTRKSTGSDGILFFNVKNTNSSKKEEVCVTVDLEAMIGSDVKDAIVRPLLSTLTAVTQRIPIEIELPTIYIEANERIYGKPLQTMGMEGVLRQELTRRGFRFVQKSQADLYLLLKADTREGNVMKDFHTAYLDLELIFEKADNGQIIHQTADSAIKGVQLSWRKAGEEAFRKGGEELKKRIIPTLVDSLL